MPSVPADLQSALDRYAAAIQEAFIAAIQAVRAAINFSELERLLRAGDVVQAAQMVSIEEGQLWGLQEAVRGAFVGSGAAVRSPGLASGAFAFNGRSLRAEQWISANGATLVQNITTDGVNAARRAITDGLASNRPLRSVALDITGRMDAVTKQRTGGIVGLTTQQVEYAINARAELEGLDPGYFDRALRDKRFDRLVRAAIKDGKPLGQADIDRIVSRYRDKMLAYRGKVIAKDQAFVAQASGRHEAYLQMAADPRFEAVTVRWQHNLSEVPRPDHVAMSGTTHNIGTPFVFPDGVQMDHPHDPAAPARHNIGCRCIAVYRAIPKV